MSFSIRCAPSQSMDGLRKKSGPGLRVATSGSQKCGDPSLMAVMHQFIAYIFNLDELHQQYHQLLLLINIEPFNDVISPKPSWAWIWTIPYITATQTEGRQVQLHKDELIHDEVLVNHAKLCGTDQNYKPFDMVFGHEGIGVAGQSDWG
ncbi:hypothetical protein JVU11DRAFT_4348 [Chiua virens]|nr:hypothetical protein JVU11DRAFT_4348 [Chiua virens]